MHVSLTHSCPYAITYISITLYAFVYISGMQSQTLEQRERITQLQRERDERKLAIAKHKELLESQQQAAHFKLDAVEDKYNFIKQINIRLEVLIIIYYYF